VKPPVKRRGLSLSVQFVVHVGGLIRHGATGPWVYTSRGSARRVNWAAGLPVKRRRGCWRQGGAWLQTYKSCWIRPVAAVTWR
jgi:hypothetical protein